MRKILLSMVIVAGSFVPVVAAVTPDQLTDPEYVINSGYSQATAESVFVQKNRVSGKPAEPLYERSNNKVVRGIKKLRAYLDPGMEEMDSIHHDIKESPAFTDL